MTMVMKRISLLGFIFVFYCSALYCDAANLQRMICKGSLRHSRICCENIAVDLHGETPVTLAVINNKFYTIEHLICAGADLDSPNTCGKNPLELAIEYHRVRIFKQLVMGGATVTESIARKATCDQHIADYLRELLATIKLGNCHDECNYMGNIDAARAAQLLTAMAAGTPHLNFLIHTIQHGAIAEGIVENIPLYDCVCRHDAPELLRYLCRHGVSFESIPESFRQEAPWFYGDTQHCRAGIYTQFTEHIVNGTLTKKFLDCYFAGRYPLNINRLLPDQGWVDGLTLALQRNDLATARLLSRYGARTWQHGLRVALAHGSDYTVYWILNNTKARLYRIANYEQLVAQNPHRACLQEYLMSIGALA